MNADKLKKLFSMLPEGPKKQELIAKYNQLQSKSKKRGGDGLNDTFELKPVGHIMIESIDENGNVLGVLADKPNLVVNGAEEILLRAFSGDPNRILYKNRVPKAASGTTNKIHISDAKLLSTPLFNGSQLLHAPNLLWSEVDDADFDISYGYYPVTLYIKEEISTEVGKKAFSLSKNYAVDRQPFVSEIHSNYSNLFIGIGEGKNAPVALDDASITYSAGVTKATGRISATAVNEKMEFTAKISNFSIDVEMSNTGAQIDVFINGVRKDTIESFDSSLSSPVVKTFSYGDLDYEQSTAIKIVLSGKDPSVTTPKMAITGLAHDALNTGMNGLIKEFKNFETVFSTPILFNTTPMAPYTVQLPNFPVKPGTVGVNYEGFDFTEVANTSLLTGTSFVVDAVHGVLTFNRALSGVMVTYEVTGEIYDTELVSTMTASTLPYTSSVDTVVTGETPTGAVNSSNRNFTVSKANVKAPSLVVKINGTPTLAFTFDVATRTVSFTTAPTVGQVITVDYTWVNTTTVNKPLNQYVLPFLPKAGSIELKDQDGNIMTLAADAADFGNGKYIMDTVNPNMVKLSTNKADGNPVTRVEIKYRSDDRPGVPTNYTRAVIDKPKTANAYPWFQLDKGSVKFVAEFPELKPNHNITIREMALFDGPRIDDKIAGFRNYPVKAFSVVRVGETRKEVNTGIRITWTITMLNASGQPFKGGF